MKCSAVHQLTQLMAQRSEPLLIRIDESDCIVAAHISCDSRFDMGLVFRHPEGPVDIGVNAPSWRVYFGWDTAAFRQSSFDEQRIKVIADYEELSSPPAEHDFNWVTGSGADSEEEFYLRLDDTIEEDLVMRWPADDNLHLSEGAAGCAILNVITEEEAAALGLRVIDFGGPASSVLIGWYIPGSSHWDKLGAISSL